MDKIKVGILGATGTVGQKFVALLENHPWFEVTELAASKQSAGKIYSEAVHWTQKSGLPEKISRLTVKECKPDLDCRIVFSGLDASVAGGIEEEFASAGYAVFSNARNHRYDHDVPLMIPELNAGHADLIDIQQENRSWPGFIVTNPNCSTIFLAMALYPLHQKFTVEKVSVVTMQAVSGAGYPGVASLDILGNVMPFISGEEEKIAKETRKILGKITNGKIEDADIPVSAQCNRVSVEDGHLESISVKLREKTSIAEISEIYKNFKASPQELNLPSAPGRPTVVMEEPDRPQPKYDIMVEKGMATVIGRIQTCPVLDYRMIALGHNTIRGAAGASILNAELLLKQGQLDNIIKNK
ncbi:MAG: aspartate-semialdehyde dehydrogenase [Calditrichaceae bacterium]